MSGSVRQGISFVVSGPSGAGKSTLLRGVLERDPGVGFSISHTTRTPRPGEGDGVDYHFVDEAAFRGLIDQDAFLEWAEYQGNLYGTSQDAVRVPTASGRDLILEVEVQGARQLRQRLPDAVFIFIIPPSAEILEARLRGRGSDADDVIRKRLERAREELRAINDYAYVIVNEVAETAIGDLLSVIQACRLERERVLPLYRDRFDFG